MSDEKEVELSDVRDIVERQGECVGCSAGVVLEHYPHENGVNIKGIGKQWVYGHCDECGYDSALWKILNRIEAKKK